MKLYAKELSTTPSSGRCPSLCIGLTKKAQFRLIFWVFIIWTIISIIALTRKQQDKTCSNQHPDASLIEFSDKEITSRHSTCTPDVYPNLTYGTNKTSAYQNPNASLNAQDQIISSEKYSNYTDFKLLLQSAIARRLIRFGDLPINALFVGPLAYDIPHPRCDGLWLEFGVFRGESISKAAQWKSTYCDKSTKFVYGFDSFEGLPVDWRPGYQRGHFNLSGNLLSNLLPNIKLIKGWFIDSLPSFLQKIDRSYPNCVLPVTYLHVDSDLYESARDIFYLLSNRFVPGSIILFDELTNYPMYDKHEMKVLFEYMTSHPEFQLRVIGAATPMHLQPPHDIYYQSVAFVVV